MVDRTLPRNHTNDACEGVHVFCSPQPSAGYYGMSTFEGLESDSLIVCRIMERVHRYADDWFKVEELDAFLSSFCSSYPKVCSDSKKGLRSYHIFPSVHHKNHGKYTTQDVHALDPQLAARIMEAAQANYHYGDRCLKGNTSIS